MTSTHFSVIPANCSMTKTNCSVTSAYCSVTCTNCLVTHTKCYPWFNQSKKRWFWSRNSEKLIWKVCKHGKITNISGHKDVIIWQEFLNLPIFCLILEEQNQTYLSPAHFSPCSLSSCFPPGEPDDPGVHGERVLFTWGASPGDRSHGWGKTSFHVLVVCLSCTSQKIYVRS